jgi:hypothetical protein
MLTKIAFINYNKCFHFIHYKGKEFYLKKKKNICSVRQCALDSGLDILELHKTG